MIILRYLLVTFDLDITPRDIPAFRGAVIHKVGKINDLFHNHNNDEGDKKLFHRRYPLIQYRYHKGQATIACFQEGVEEIQKLFMQEDWTIQLKETPVKLTIKNLQLKEFNVGLTSKPNTYRIRRYLPFSSSHFMDYQAIPYEIEKIQFLEKQLTSHIMGFASGIGWNVEDTIKVRILKIIDSGTREYKGVRMMDFEIDFSVNVDLPYHIALGKGISHGFGKLGKIPSYRNVESTAPGERAEEV